MSTRLCKAHTHLCILDLVRSRHPRQVLERFCGLVYPGSTHLLRGVVAGRMGALSGLHGSWAVRAGQSVRVRVYIYTYI